MKDINYAELSLSELVEIYLEVTKELQARTEETKRSVGRLVRVENLPPAKILRLQVVDTSLLRTPKELNILSKYPVGITVSEFCMIPEQELRGIEKIGIGTISTIRSRLRDLGITGAFP